VSQYLFVCVVGVGMPLLHPICKICLFVLLYEETFWEAYKAGFVNFNVNILGGNDVKFACLFVV
jgi:hypothetical protein